MILKKRRIVGAHITIAIDSAMN